MATFDALLWKRLEGYEIKDSKNGNLGGHFIQMIAAKRSPKMPIDLKEIDETPYQKLVVSIDNETNYIGPRLWEIVSTFLDVHGKFGDED